MRRGLALILCQALVSTALVPNALLADFLSLQRRVGEIFAENSGALVRVKAVYDGQSPEDGSQLVVGTGFFVSREGLVLTNASIVLQPVRIWVEHNQIAYAAQLIGLDQPSNIALLRLDNTPPQFNFIHIGDSPDLPPVATFAVRISMPLEFEPTPDIGLIAGHESRLGDHFFPCVYVRTNLPAGPGDGGSPVLDLNGRLLGIQVGALPDIGASYILPTRAIARLRDDLLFSGSIIYGWIGFEITEERAIGSGCRLMIREVLRNTPAEAIGILAGDQLVRIGGYPIANLDDLRNAMFYTRIGHFVEVVVRRADRVLQFNVRVARRPIEEPLEIIHKVESDMPTVILDPRKGP
jgi:S1-C subfamily serine protease